MTNIAASADHLLTNNPYRIEGPALISFSGGRTSAYMLRMILDAHGGTLPNDVYVCFANTGKEREETLRFVHECQSRWGVPVHWLEYRHTGRGAKPADRFEEVGYNSANRTGEPFAKLIEKKQYLPNSQMRYCTEKLKIDTMKWFMRSLGHGSYTNAVGLRADEMHRVFKQIARNEGRKDKFFSVMPLADAKVTKRDVLLWWRSQPFDLGLKPYEGNCDLCFLRGRDKKRELLREFPEMAKWWSGIEHQAAERGTVRTAYMKRFDKDETVDQLLDSVQRQPMFDLPEPGMFDYAPDQWQALPAVEQDRLLAEELAQEGGIECGTACSGEEQTPQQISKAADRLYAFAQQMGDIRKKAA